jgi:hypothetical protein
VECSERKPDIELEWNMCGEECYAIDNFTCDISCPNFYEPNKETLFCELIPCSSRRPEPAEPEANCGSDCFYTSNTNICSSECDWFYEASSELDGVCVLLMCEERTPIGNSEISPSSPLVCGYFPCFMYDGVCLSECPNELIYDKTGVCVEGNNDENSKRKSVIIIIAISAFVGIVVIVLVVIIIALCVRKKKDNDEVEGLSQFNYTLQNNVCLVTFFFDFLYLIYSYRNFLL